MFGPKLIKLNSGLGGAGVADQRALETAELFRKRANELRRIAADTPDKAARKALLEVADNYERMAQDQAGS